MKRIVLNRKGARSAFFALLLFLIFTTPLQVRAQDEGPLPQSGEQPANVQGQKIGDQLGLTPEQKDRIKSITLLNAEERRETNQRLRQAQRALDEAIYGDNVDEAVIDQRARELAEAQAASIRLRARTELQIRRVLTPEQLGKLREIRARAAEARKQRMQQQRTVPGGNLRDLQREEQKGGPRQPRSASNLNHNGPLHKDSGKPEVPARNLAPREKRR